MRKLLIAALSLTAVPVSAQPPTSPPAKTTSLTRDAAELVAQDFILDGSGLSDLELADRIQVWNIAVSRLRKFGLEVAALPAIRAAYQADRLKYAELAKRENGLDIDLYTALAGNDMKTAAAVQPQLDKVTSEEKAVLQHMRLDTYLSELARH